MQIDEKVAAEAAGIDLRTCTTKEVQAHLAPLVSLQQVCQQCLNTNNKRANTKIKLKSQVLTISISNRAHRFRINSVSSEPSLLYREIKIKEGVCHR